MTNYKKKYCGREKEVIQQLLESDGNHDYVLELEEVFRNRFDRRYGTYAIAMNSGTATLHSSLEAIGVVAGDEVITTPLTAFMDTSCILQANAIPVYADVDCKTLCIDPLDVERKITNKTKAILAVSLYGYPCDIGSLMKIAKKYDIVVIEDNAQHLGNHRAHITSYSFESSKHLSCGEGGMVLTSNEEWARKIRSIGNHGFIGNNACERGSVVKEQDVFNWKRHSLVGWNYRMTDFCAAILLVQLERENEIISKRIEYAHKFLELFNSFKKEINFYTQPIEGNDYWTLAIWGNKALSKYVIEKCVEYQKNTVRPAWSISYFEPLMLSGKFKNRNPEVYKNFDINKSCCRNAESAQQTLMQIKTSYCDDEEFEQDYCFLEQVLCMI